jgi:hypothetical protein
MILCPEDKLGMSEMPCKKVLSKCYDKIPEGKDSVE